MANETMTLIATGTVGAGGAANITFSSIPNTYTDLVVMLSARSSGTNTDAAVYFNGTSGTFRRLYGNGSTAQSDTYTEMVVFIGNSSQTANTFGNASIYISNYVGSTNKAISFDSVSENNGTTGYQGITAGLWANSAAITSIALFSTNFVQYSTASLYGITKGSGGATVS